MAIYGYKTDGTPLKSQRETILYYLRLNPGQRISQWKALKEFGFTRLSAIVKDIEKRNHIYLARTLVKVMTPYGRTTYVTEYWYKDESGQDK